MSKRLVVAVVAVVVLTVGGAVAAQSVQRFSDVPADHPQAGAIEWAAEVGLTTGYGDGTFRPETPLSKSHALIFMERFYDDVLQAIESDGFTRGDMMELLQTINNAPAVAPTAEPDASACAAHRRTAGRFFSGVPVERVEVTVVTVAFDDLPSPTDGHIPAPGTDAEQRFFTELLTALEVKLEALSHGRTDWVFHRDGEIRLPGSAHTRANSGSRRGLVGAVAELAYRYPDQRLLAFHTTTPEFRYESFYLERVSMVSVQPEPEPEPNYLSMYQRSRTRFSGALFAAAHELLHQLGLDDLYGINRNDGRGRADRDIGEDSMMGLSSYGWGRGTITDDSLPNMTLSNPTPEHPHGPFTGWNKWLLGWLGPDDAVCVSTTEPVTVALRPHQRTTLHNIGLQQWSPDYTCWGWSHLRGRWGPAAMDPAIAIIPVSETTIIVIEADPWAIHRPPAVPQCFIGELPYNQDQCLAPEDHQSQAGDTSQRKTRYVGDIIVYDVDLTAFERPQLLVTPTVAVVSPAIYDLEAHDFGPTGEIGRFYVPGGQNDREGTRGPWPDGLPVDCYFLSELTIHGYRIAVERTTTTANGEHEVIVTIEPPS